VYFEGLSDHDIIICNEKELGLKKTITQTHESKMTPVFWRAC